MINTIVAVSNVLSVIIIFITAIILSKQIKAIKEASYASAFKAIFDILQTDDMRNARGFVFKNLENKEFKTWTPEDLKQAEKVCQSYDVVGIMVKNNIIPEEIIADSWGYSLRMSWKILSPLVYEYRVRRNSNEFWDDYEYLSKVADKYKKKITS